MRDVPHPPPSWQSGCIQTSLSTDRPEQADGVSVAGTCSSLDSLVSARLSAQRGRVCGRISAPLCAAVMAMAAFAGAPFAGKTSKRGQLSPRGVAHRSPPDLRPRRCVLSCRCGPRRCGGPRLPAAESLDEPGEGATCAGIGDAYFAATHSTASIGVAASKASGMPGLEPVGSCGVMLDGREVLEAGVQPGVASSPLTGNKEEDSRHNTTKRQTGTFVAILPQAVRGCSLKGCASSDHKQQIERPGFLSGPARSDGKSVRLRACAKEVLFR